MAAPGPAAPTLSTLSTLALMTFSDVGHELAFAKKVSDQDLAHKYAEPLNHFISKMLRKGIPAKAYLIDAQTPEYARARGEVLRANLDYFSAVNELKCALSRGEYDGKDYADAYDPWDEKPFMKFMAPMLGKNTGGSLLELKMLRGRMADAFRLALKQKLEVHFDYDFALLLPPSTPSETPTTVFEPPPTISEPPPTMSNLAFSNLSELQRLIVLAQNES